ncbi:glucosamine-6-phosphate isomerase 2-like [Mya arenaria]|uniref:glucosamine-6-phosphate isomerase 2-like n=1 Tax=Mya arenaria TaxID=6604 RepID=UPI0022DF4AD0|nr:glucosamine-6-phosphate isomerase 2-like [Mya arenaria]
MRLVITDTAADVADWAAKYIKKKITEFNPGPDNYFTLGLPTGSTPLGTYKKLIEFHKEGKLSFKYVKTFNMDEYCDLPRDHPESYHSFMFNSFFKHIDIDPANALLLDGNAPDLEKECDEYERKIKEAGGIQLFLGGIGPDGHIAFNEPGSSLVSRTRVKTLAQETIIANARFFGGDIAKVPTRALTVGVATVMEAKEVMILITGAHKAYALHKAIEGGVSHMFTVSAFQMHQCAIFVCDEDATMELKVRTVKYFKGLNAVHHKLIEDA